MTSSWGEGHAADIGLWSSGIVARWFRTLVLTDTSKSTEPDPGRPTA